MSATGPDCWCPEGVEVGGQLTGPECRGWISDRSQGQLRHHTGRGPRAVVVNYAVTDDQVVVRLPEYNEICQYALGRLVTLNVSGTCSNTWMRTEVSVTGVGHFARTEAQLPDAVDLAEHWPAGMATYIMCLDLSDIQGSARASSNVVASGRRPQRPKGSITGACVDILWPPSPIPQLHSSGPGSAS